MMNSILLLLWFPLVGFSQPLLEGLWRKPCELIQDDWVSSELRVQKSQWHFVYWGYEDKACRKKYLQFEQILKASLVSPNLDLQVENILYTPLTQEVAEALNQIAFCNFREWKINQSHSVLDQLCESVDSYRKNQMIYSLFRVFPETTGLFLKLGRPGPETDGSRPEKRHQDYEATAYEKSK